MFLHIIDVKKEGMVTRRMSDFFSFGGVRYKSERAVMLEE